MPFRNTVPQVLLCLFLSIARAASCEESWQNAAPGNQPSTRSSVPSASAKPLTLAERFQNKLQSVEENAKKAQPDQRPTDFPDNELNAWLASDKVKLPVGVQRVVFHTQANKIQSDLRADFDAITESKRATNPLLYLFTGIHDVTVIADAHADHGKATAQVRSVAIDGIEVPRIALELFVKRYLQPRYPKAALDSVFDLPARIDSAIIAKGHTMIYQK